MPSWVKRGRWLLPVFLLAFLVHADALGYWFVASDTIPLIETGRVSALGGVVGVFTRPLMAGSDFANTALFYRPVASLTYAADYAVWGLTPFGYHLTNLVLHAVAVVLAAVVVTNLTDRPAVGILTAVLFAVHPVTAEVVPVTARRQDILLTVFALASIGLFVGWYRAGERSRGTDGDRSRRLGGALVAYALALGSKETGVAVVALLAVWVVLQVGVDRPRRTLRALAGTVGPFVAVTAGYLALRTVAVGGFGGYSASTVPSRSVTDVLGFGVKYVLWLTYPLNAIEEATAMVPGGSLSLIVLVPVVLVAGWVGVIRLARQGVFDRGRFQRLRVVSPVGAVVGFATIPLVLAATARSGSVVSPSGSGVLPSYLVGLLFVGACAAIVATTLLAQESPLDGRTGRQLAFFGCWVVLPLGLVIVSAFVTSQPWEFGFGMRNAYFALVPAMAVLSLVVVSALRNVIERASHEPSGVRVSSYVSADAARALGVVLLVVPLLVASPAVVPNGSWQAAGALNEKSLRGLGDALEDAPNETRIYVADFPHGFDDRQRPYPHVHSVTPLRPYSVEAWLELHGHPPDTKVGLVRKRTVAEVPAEISFRVERRDGWVAVWTTSTDGSKTG